MQEKQLTLLRKHTLHFKRGKMILTVEMIDRYGEANDWLSENTNIQMGDGKPITIANYTLLRLMHSELRIEKMTKEIEELKLAVGGI